jgi:hypothetical protein
MKLSEAIRAGAARVGWRQCRYSFFSESISGQIHACALGAGYLGQTGLEAEGIDPGICWSDLIETRFDDCPEIHACPVHDCDVVLGIDDPDAFVIISHLNDEHRWTFLKIAAWLEVEEAKQARESDHVMAGAEVSFNL